MTKHTVAQLCAIAAVISLPTLSFAGTTAKGDAGSCKSCSANKVAESAITGDLGVNVVTSYYSRGILQATNRSANFQPYLDLSLKAYEGDGFLNKAVFGLGLWGNLTSSNFTKSPRQGGFIQAAGTNNSSWTETDVTPSVALTFGKLTLTESYLFLNFPNANAGADAQGLSSKLSYDDSDLLGAFALHPSVTHTLELDGKVGINASGEKGSYWEVAVAPSSPVGPVTVTLPITLGFGSNGFYKADGYAYLAAGVNVSYQLPVAKSYGTWTANAGATYYNTSNKATGNENGNNDVVGSLGLGVAF